jgi:hypothetical protein
VTGYPFEFQRQIVSAAVDIRPQNLQIPDVLAPEPAQELPQEHVLDQVLAGAAILSPSELTVTAIRFPWRGSPLEWQRMRQQS